MAVALLRWDMKTEITTTEANEMVFDQSKEELKRSLKMLLKYIEFLEHPDFDDFSGIGIISHQVMREAYGLNALKQSTWIESESKRPMTLLEKQLEESRKKADNEN
jgi:hypothetical protein